MSYKDEFFPLEGTLFLEKCAALIKKERLHKKLRQQDICEMVNISLIIAIFCKKKKPPIGDLFFGAISFLN